MVPQRHPSGSDPLDAAGGGAKKVEARWLDLFFASPFGKLHSKSITKHRARKFQRQSPGEAWTRAEGSRAAAPEPRPLSPRALGLQNRSSSQSQRSSSAASRQWGLQSCSSRAAALEPHHHGVPEQGDGPLSALCSMGFGLLLG